MIKDNGLFAANNPIGRLWYFINIFILFCLAAGADWLVNGYVIPNANTSYAVPAKWFLYAAYFVLIITFMSIVHRRIYDICGTKDAGAYKLVSRITGFTAVLYALELFAVTAKADFPDVFYLILMIWSAVFCVMVFLLGLFPGRFISSQE